MEEWKDIEITGGKYQVSSNGEVKRTSYWTTNSLGRRFFYKERMMTPNLDKDGYVYYMLMVDHHQKSFRAHRLVLAAFDPIQNMASFQVNHKNGKKSDNRLENLEWCTASQNIRHRLYQLNVNPLIATRQVRCRETGEIFPSLREAARHYGNGNHSGLKQVLSPKFPTRHTYKGYHWDYL